MLALGVKQRGEAKSTQLISSGKDGLPPAVILLEGMERRGRHLDPANPQPGRKNRTDQPENCNGMVPCTVPASAFSLTRLSAAPTILLSLNQVAPAAPGDRHGRHNQKAERVHCDSSSKSKKAEG
jgi:hypothetical protein